MTVGPILVTGAGGFVCSEVALALHRAGTDVVAVDRVFDAATTARLSEVRCIEGHLQQVLAAGAIPAVSGVIHGAAITASPQRLGISCAAHIRRNTDMLTTTLDFAREAGADRFLYLSSMGVFATDDVPSPEGRFTEATQPTATGPYCAAKRAGELLTASAAEPGFTSLSLRLGNIFGAHEAMRESRQHLCLVSRMINEARASSVITVQTPKVAREWAWLPDLAATIARLVADLPAIGPRVLHAGTPPVLTDLDVARAIADRLPGTTIRLASPPHDRVRLPMANGVSGIFDDAGWTGVEDALDLLIPAEVAQ